MSRLQRFWASSIGAKLTMAVTGLLLFGFVVGHLAGNLAVYKGQDAVNHYAEFLHSKGALLWVVRLGLIAVALAHIVSGLRLARDNRAARPVPYAKQANLVSTRAARSMVLTGLTLTGYVLFHLAHFTWAWILTDHAHQVDAQGRHDVYAMVVQGFGEWWVSGLYLVAMVTLFFHLRHGIASFFQTIGFRHPRYLCCVEWLGTILSAVIFLGYASIPVACLLGWVGNGGA